MDRRPKRLGEGRRSNEPKATRSASQSALWLSGLSFWEPISKAGGSEMSSSSDDHETACSQCWRLSLAISPDPSNTLNRAFPRV